MVRWLNMVMHTSRLIKKNLNSNVSLSSLIVIMVPLVRCWCGRRRRVSLTPIHCVPHRRREATPAPGATEHWSHVGARHQLHQLAVAPPGFATGNRRAQSGGYDSQRMKVLVFKKNGSYTCEDLSVSLNVLICSVHLC